MALVAVEQYIPKEQRVIDDGLAARLLPVGATLFRPLAAAPLDKELDHRSEREEQPRIWGRLLCRERYNQREARCLPDEIEAVVSPWSEWSTQRRCDSKIKLRRRVDRARNRLCPRGPWRRHTIHDTPDSQSSHYSVGTRISRRQRVGQRIDPVSTGNVIAPLSTPQLSQSRNCALLPLTITGSHPMPRT
jgi:hypothetical protein